jgi:NAD(P)-dependent dehydrogenase (short-subunit alcohol dehydrogenase family)
MPQICLARLPELVGEFIRDVGDGTYDAKGRPGCAYRVSKVRLSPFTGILARGIEQNGVHVNAVCPEWVRTDMGVAGAPRNVGQSARSIVWAATLSDDGPSGGFFRDGEPISR